MNGKSPCQYGGVERPDERVQTQVISITLSIPSITVSTFTTGGECQFLSINNFE